jgi:uncharacterized protein YnzC (UPF0291/DUF896 family)
MAHNFVAAQLKPDALPLLARLVLLHMLKIRKLAHQETGMALESKEAEAAKRRQSLVDETRAKAHEHLEHVKAVHDAHQA